jgi:hypothetical protein
MLVAFDAVGRTPFPRTSELALAGVLVESPKSLITEPAELDIEIVPVVPTSIFTLSSNLSKFVSNVPLIRLVVELTPTDVILALSKVLYAVSAAVTAVDVIFVFSVVMFVFKSNELPELDNEELIAFVIGVTFTTVPVVGDVANTLTKVSEPLPTVPLTVTTYGGVKLEGLKVPVV